MSNKSWNGNVERRHNPSDHDNLIRVITLLAEHVKNFDTHVLDDKILSKKVDFHSKMIYIGIGGLGMINIFVGYLSNHAH